MRVLVSGASKTVERFAVPPSRDRLGVLLTPAAGNTPDYAERLGLPYAADNAAFSSFNPARFVRMLETLSGRRPMWVACPDHLASAAETARLFRVWAPVIRAYKLPVALVLQDGQEQYPVPWDQVEAVFLGGSTDFKMSLLALNLLREARTRQKWTHVGRVNTRSRVRHFAQIPIHSFDGTGVSRWPNANLGPTLRWIAQATH